MTSPSNAHWAEGFIQEADRCPPAGLNEVGRGNDRPANVERSLTRRPLVEDHRQSGSSQGYLESTGIQLETREGYRGRALDMLRWIEFHRFAFWTIKQIDAAISSFFDELFAAGDHVSEGQKCLAAFIFFFPSVAGKSGVLLLRSKRALKSWSLRDRPRTKTPLLWEGVCGIAVVLSSWGFIDVAIWVLMIFDLFSRPTEGLLDRLCDVVMPSSMFPTAGVKLNPMDAGRPSKTKFFDEVLQMSTGARLPCSALLVWWVGEALRRGLTRVCERSYAQVSSLFRAAAQTAGLGARTLYELRHGGASHSAYLGWSLKEVQKRGRWGSFDSVLRYNKTGPLQESWNKLKPQTQNFLLECTKNVEAYVRSGFCPTIPVH